MKSRTVICAALTAALLPTLRVSAAINYYVSDSGTIDLYAVTDGGVITTPAGINYNSGNLQQLSVSGGNHTGIAGSLTYAGLPRIQSADGSIADTAQIGALHALVKANVTTDGYPYG